MDCKDLKVRLPGCGVIKCMDTNLFITLFSVIPMCTLHDFKMDRRNVQVIQKNEHEWSFFLYNLNIFNRIQLLTNTDSALYSNKFVIERFWYIYFPGEQTNHQVTSSAALLFWTPDKITLQ